MQPALKVSSLSGPSMPTSVWIRLKPVVDAFKFGALALMILAMAGPQKGVEEQTILTEGINIVLAVDASESMAALDFEQDGQVVDRLRAVKSVIESFIAGRIGDRIGLVVFGSEAYTQTPLTRDYSAIIQNLERLEIGAAGPQTAIGDALGIALKRLPDVPAKNQVIILLTDGRSNTGELSPEITTTIAAEQGVKVYTIGVGGDKPAPFLIRDPVGGRRVVYRNVDIDESSLKRIAEETGGLYFRATDTDGLIRIYDTIDQMEKNTVEVQTFAEYSDLYFHFLLPAFILLTLWVVLTNTRLLRLP
jgi:Ca-activated chloride channel homolog